MRKCKLNSEQYSKKFSTYRTAVNSRSRYDYSQYKKRIGVLPNSQRSKAFSKSKKNKPNNSFEDDDQGLSSSNKKSVTFSSPLSQQIPLNDELVSSPLVLASKPVSSNASSTISQEPTTSSNSGPNFSQVRYF